ncbi:GNAT family N-acetyltransferase [Gordonia rubripertincta]|uniref:GNAT family N-acetyltransferase n=1 Tax=Gordonia rubripertincta TaxID=36822 RepID=A0ABT4MRD3_GORRU|nr:GNAT family N-acetyltransferase [Gordonia rubripertincta]MCZ4549561.1 GNAT family N-acetyltransferase [Gordonia rubripertincta]
MSVTIAPLTMDGFENLPPHSRRCVFWEMDPNLIPDNPGGVAFESEFDKEAWVSMILLEWGTCGQVAVSRTTGKVVGAAFYGPPRSVPRSLLFPTSPVSPDAVILNSLWVDPGYDDAAAALTQAVIIDLTRRGVRAIEAFGIVRSAHTSPNQDPENDAICARCMIDAHFLKGEGFDVVSAHHRYPRLRLALDNDLGWKAGVESALEKLVVMAAIDVAGRERTAVPVGSARHLLRGE